VSTVSLSGKKDCWNLSEEGLEDWTDVAVA
jgi:hypothetical protein